MAARREREKCRNKIELYEYMTKESISYYSILFTLRNKRMCECVNEMKKEQQQQQQQHHTNIETLERVIYYLYALYSTFYYTHTHILIWIFDK